MQLVIARHGSYTEPLYTPEKVRKDLERGDIPSGLTQELSEDEIIDKLADKKELNDQGKKEMDALADALLGTESLGARLSDAVILSSSADRAYLSAKRLQDKLGEVHIERHGRLYTSSSNVYEDAFIMKLIEDCSEGNSLVVAITHMYTARAIVKNLLPYENHPSSNLETGQAFLVDLESKTCELLP